METKFTAKKGIIILAILVAGALVAQANAATIVDHENPATVENKCDNFVAIEFKDLDEAVQTAIFEELEKHGHNTVKRAARHKENNDIAIVAVDAEDNEVVYLFDETGKRKENKE